MKRRKNLKLKGVIGCLLLISFITGLLFWHDIRSSLAKSEDQDFWEQETTQGTGATKSQPLPEIDSQHGVLINLSTNQVVGEKKRREKIYPASMTKIMAAHVVIKHMPDLNQPVVVSGKVFDHLQSAGASMAGFFRDENVPAKELLYGTLLSSGAEATVALAIAVAGSEKEFVKLMNQEAESIGMTSTHFQNATGLHQRQHYSTVSDMALLLETALKNETFAEIFTTKEHVYHGDYHQEGLFLASTLFSHMPAEQGFTGEIEGGKTGYTEEAGQCLASLATVNGQRYILVTAGASGTPLTEARHIDDALKVYGSL